MVFFAASWVITAVGWVIHVFVDRHPDKRTGHRVPELFLLWMLVVTGVFAIIGGLWAYQRPFAGTRRPNRLRTFDVPVGGWLGRHSVGRPTGHGRKAELPRWLANGGSRCVGGPVRRRRDWPHHAADRAQQHRAEQRLAIPSDIAQPVIAIVVLLAYRRGQHRLAESKRGAVDSQGAQEGDPSKWPKLSFAHSQWKVVFLVRS